MSRQHNIELLTSDKMFVFKVRDYETLLVGRYNCQHDYFYIQRGDGLILNTYDSSRITFKQELTYANEIKS